MNSLPGQDFLELSSPLHERVVHAVLGVIKSGGYL